MFLNNEGTLKGKACVATVMSNKALEDYLKSNGLNLIRTDVGDKHVLQEMKKK